MLRQLKNKSRDPWHTALLKLYHSIKNVLYIHSITITEAFASNTPDSFSPLLQLNLCFTNTKVINAYGRSIVYNALKKILTWTNQISDWFLRDQNVKKTGKFVFYSFVCLVFFNQKSQCLVLLIKTLELDAEVKTCWLRQAERTTSWPSSSASVPALLSSSTLAQKSPQTQTSLLPTCCVYLPLSSWLPLTFCFFFFP